MQTLYEINLFDVNKLPAIFMSMQRDWVSIDSLPTTNPSRFAPYDARRYKFQSKRHALVWNSRLENWVGAKGAAAVVHPLPSGHAVNTSMWAWTKHPCFVQS